MIRVPLPENVGFAVKLLFYPEHVGDPHGCGHMARSQPDDRRHCTAPIVQQGAVKRPQNLEYFPIISRVR